MIARLLISSSLKKLKKEIEKTIPSYNHPDVLFFPSDSKLGIAEARKIKMHFSLKPYSLKGRIVCLEDASALTHEAQNALLKTLEELPQEGQIILGANSEAHLLPTILSRCQIIRLQTSDVRLQNNDIEELLSASIEKRFEYVEKLKDKEAFLRSLVSYFHKKGESHKFLEELLQAEEWSKANVNIRAILEHLMLVMP